jgi:hypothetical protein
VGGKRLDEVLNREPTPDSSEDLSNREPEQLQAAK